MRVPANTPDYIGRVLDGGAMGVITPHVRSAGEAREMVQLVHSHRSAAVPAGGALSQYQYRSFPITETNAAMNNATSLVLMLETAAALDNVEEIIATEGVDMMMIGSNDLCGERGFPASTTIRSWRPRSSGRSPRPARSASISALVAWQRVTT